METEKQITCRKCGALKGTVPFSKWQKICKACIAKYDHLHYDQNKEKYKKYNHKWRSANLKRARLRDQGYYAKYQEKYLANKREYYRANLERIREVLGAYQHNYFCYEVLKTMTNEELNEKLAHMIFDKVYLHAEWTQATPTLKKAMLDLANDVIKEVKDEVLPRADTK